MNWLRKLFGVSKCSTKEELIAYIPVGDLAALWNWTDWWVPYRPDKGPADNFRPIEEILHRAANGRGDDCEGIHMVPFTVVDSPRWKAKGWKAGLAVLWRPNPPAHAIFTFEKPDGCKGYINYGVHVFPRTASWSEVFESIPGGWTEAWWVDVKGNRLPRAGWKR